MRTLAFVALTLLGFSSVPAAGDTPLPPPRRHEVLSPDKRHVAVSDPATGATTVFRIGASDRREALWVLPGWHRSLFLADGGEVVIVGYPGLNLLSLRETPATEVLRFVRRGETLALVRLADVVPDMKVLKRTASHWAWREAQGWSADGRDFVLVTIDGVRHVFDPRTGRKVEPQTDVERLEAWMTGTFSSAAQAQQDPAFRDLVLHVVPIWRQRSDGPWLYAEQAVAEAPGAPLRQRVHRLRDLGEGLFESRAYELTGATGTGAVGAWKGPNPLGDLGPDALAEMPGCAVLLRRVDDTTFSGSTLGSQCKSAVPPGAAYATCELTVTAGGLLAWERGYDAAGAQVWGSATGPYRFERLPDGAR